MYIYKHIFRHIYKHNRTCTHAHALSHTHTQAHVCTHLYTLSNARPRKCIRTCSHRHRHQHQHYQRHTCMPIYSNIVVPTNTNVPERERVGVARNSWGSHFLPILEGMAAAMLCDNKSNTSIQWVKSRLLNPNRENSEKTRGRGWLWQAHTQINRLTCATASGFYECISSPKRPTRLWRSTNFNK